MNKSHILIVDDDPQVREIIRRFLTSRGGNYQVMEAEAADQALDLIKKYPFDHVLCDIYMDPKDGFYFLKEARNTGFPGNIIMISGKADTDVALRAIQEGACDYIHKPITVDQLFFVLKRIEEQTRLRRENERLRKEVQEQYSFHNIVAKSQKMRHIFNIIEKVADYKTTVLITGESGTGKELVAKALHYNSIRRKGPFVAVNCGGIPDTLLESELFGHARGAFTDALRAKKGLFEEAHGGTLFLDELGELPLALQVKLLRVLQEEEIRPLGETRVIKIDVRIVAATARDLATEVKKGRFREDLYYRVNVLPIALPPLRERKEDIPLLVDHFIEKYNRRLGTSITGVTKEAMNLLLNYRWPGNVRELENVLERAMVLADGTMIDTKDLPPNLLTDIVAESQVQPPWLDESILSIKKSSKILEKELIRRALAKTKGNKTQAAQILEISLPALLYKMKDYGIS